MTADQKSDQLKSNLADAVIKIDSFYRLVEEVKALQNEDREEIHGLSRKMDYLISLMAKPQLVS